VHHGLWDYDLPTQPMLMPITVDGRSIDAVVQLTKQGLTFVFDRVTGEPVWPVEERPVPQSDVPGEQTSPTQPFPTRPPALTPTTGMSLDDAFDLTPALQAAARGAMQQLRFGPLYTPPSLEGSLVRPGGGGAVNWGGGAYDAQTGFLYVKTSNVPAVLRLEKFDPATTRNPFADTTEPDYVGYDTAPGGRPTFEGGLLLNKPRGMITGRGDPEGRPSVLDLVSHVPVRVEPVGRLVDNLDVVELPELKRQLAAGRLLVVGDQDPQGHSIKTGDRAPKIRRLIPCLTSSDVILRRCTRRLLKNTAKPSRLLLPPVSFKGSLR